MVNVPIPATVDYPSQGLVGSLQSETLKWSSPAITSVACKGNTRPYTNTFTATLPGQANEVTKTSGSASCKASK